MPRLPVTNGAHTIFTDHRIAIYTPQEIAAWEKLPSHSASSGPPAPSGSLVPWRDPPAQFAQRNLGLGNVKVGERLKSLVMVSEGYRLLVECMPRFPNDPAVLTANGQVLLGVHRYAEAASMFERVVRLRPDSASNHLHAALAWKRAGDDRNAVSELNVALRLDPLISSRTASWRKSTPLITIPPCFARRMCVMQPLSLRASTRNCIWGT